MQGAYSEFRAGWKIVLASAAGVGAGVTGLSYYSFGILMTPLSDTFGWSRTGLSGARSLLTLGFVVTAPFVGYLADRIGVRKMALTSMVLVALILLATTQVSANIGTFYFATIALALAGCATTPLVWTHAVASWFRRKRGLALAMTTAGTGLAGIGTPLFLGALLDRFDWRAGYIGMAAIVALALIPVALFFHENRTPFVPDTTHPGGARFGVDVAEAVRSVTFWRIGGGFLLVGAVLSSLSVHLVPMLTDGGFPRALAVKIASLLGLAVITGRLTTGYLVDRMHPPYVAGVILSLPIVGCGLLASASFSHWSVIIAAISFGFASGSEVDLLPYLTARYFGVKSYGKIYSWTFVMLYIGVSIGPLYLGYMYDLYGNYNEALYSAMPVLAIGALSIATLGKPPAFA